MASPLNVEAANGCTSPGTSGRCWNKVMDFGEAKIQVSFAVPVVLSNVFYFSITMVSVMFAGHLGEVELAASTLANSWATVTGFAFMIGLSGALETLCGQGFGAGMYKMLGIYLQASCIISFFFSLIISILWFYTEPILVLLHQDHEISRNAALYMKYLIPGLFAFGFLQNILRFLQTQSIVKPLVLFSAIPLGIHFGIVYSLVNKTSLGFKGAPMAASISIWISLILLAMYVVFANKFNSTWQGLSSESFRYIIRNLKLALPSAAMYCLEGWAFEILVFLAGLMPNPEITTSLIAICVNTETIAYMITYGLSAAASLEGWAFEILVFLAGLMPNPEITTSLIAICVNTETIAYMITYGLSAAASTRVSNELGAGNPNKAKHAMTVTLKLSVLLALVEALMLAFGHGVWAGFFSNSHSIIMKFAGMTPLLIVSIAIDSIQGVLSGAARGCGWQNLAVLANLGTFYFIGMPIAAVLGFKSELYVKGLWIGLICGLSCQACTLVLIIFYKKWTKINLSAENNEAQAV